MNKNCKVECPVTSAGRQLLVTAGRQLLVIQLGCSCWLYSWAAAAGSILRSFPQNLSSHYHGPRAFCSFSPLLLHLSPSLSLSLSPFSPPSVDIPHPPTVDSLLRTHNHMFAKIKLRPPKPKLLGELAVTKSFDLIKTYYARGSEQARERERKREREREREKRERERERERERRRKRENI